MTETIGLSPIQSQEDAATAELIERLEMAFMPMPPDDVRWFGYMRIRLPFFYEAMRIVREALGPGFHRFLEVGSGIGSNLCLANSLGFKPTGIELHEPYIHVSRRLYPFCEVIHQDASTFDGYGDFDVVYLYRIATSRKEQDDINHRISDQMHSGAIFYCPAFEGPYPEWLDHLGDAVWRKP